MRVGQGYFDLQRAAYSFKRVHKHFSKDKWKQARILFTLLTLFLILDFHGIFASAEYTILDIFLRVEDRLSSNFPAREPLPLGVAQERLSVAVVDIDDETYEKCFDRHSPLNPQKLTRLITSVARRAPAAIVVDIVTDEEPGQYMNRFDAPTYWTVAAVESEGHKERFLNWFLGSQLEGTMEQFLSGSPIRESIFASLFGAKQLMEVGLLRGNTVERSDAFWGLSSFPVDGDGAVRRIPLSYDVVPANHRLVTPQQRFAVSHLLARHSRETELKVSEHPSDVIVTYDGERPSRISALHFLRHLGSCKGDAQVAQTKYPSAFSSKEIGAENLKEALVVIGGTFGEARDTFVTPRGPAPGVAIVAEAVRAEQTGSYLIETPKYLTFIFDVLFAVVVLFILYMRPPRHMRSLIWLNILIPVGLLVFASVTFFITRRLWISWSDALLSACFVFVIDLWQENLPLQTREDGYR